MTVQVGPEYAPFVQQRLMGAVAMVFCTQKTNKACWLGTPKLRKDGRAASI
jgi:hypothetical protein